MAYGNRFMGGAYHSDNYNPDSYPSVGRVEDPESRRRREAVAAFAQDSTYITPTGHLMTQVIDPTTGEIRQLLRDLYTRRGSD